MHVSLLGQPAIQCSRPGIAQQVRVWTLAVLVLTGVLGAPVHAADQNDDKPEPPQDVTLKTRDGVTLLATYYAAGPKIGKDAVPVILLHGSKGSRSEFKPLALKLQQAGCAVIAPDLRGYGDSATAGDGDRAAEPKPADLVAMVAEDVEAVKNYLIGRNNDGELNIEKLCLVGVDMGSVVALNFAARDWSWPTLATGKQGQDVKGLVLISPEWTHRGLRINDAVAHPQVRTELSILIIAGKGSGKGAREARRLYSALERYHPEPPPGEADKKMLWLRTPPTTLQGMTLVNEKRMLVDEMIEKFIEIRLVDAHIPWRERRSPLE